MRNYKTAVCVACKNSEDLDIYCQHYLNLGFDKVFIFEDKGSIPLKPYVQKFGNRVIHDYLPDLPDKYYGNTYEGCIRQLKLYNWFLEHHKDDFDWIAFFDDDEYMYLPENINLHQFLDIYKNKSAVYLYWDILRIDDIFIDETKNILELNWRRNYNFLPSCVIWELKSIVNTKLVSHLTSIHYAEENGCDIFGRNFNWLKRHYGSVYMIKNEQFDKIPHIKHYFFRSFEAWFKKLLLRGDMFPGNRELYHWMENTNISKEELTKYIEVLCKKYNVNIHNIKNSADSY